MRKFSKLVALAMAIVMVAALALTGCNKPDGALAQPSSVTYADGTLTWSAVEGATSYDVTVYKGKEVALDTQNVKTTSLNVSSLAAGNYTAGVVAKADGKTSSAEKKADFTVAEALKELATPTGFAYDEDKITWTAVAGATSGYAVKVVNESGSTVFEEDAVMSAELDVSELAAGKYTVTVTANAVAGAALASKTASYEFTVADAKLATPSGGAVDVSARKVTWTAVENAAGYQVTATDGAEQIFDRYVTANEVNIDEAEVDEFTLSIVAVGEEGTENSDPYVYEVKINAVKIEAPSEIKTDDDCNILSWKEVAGSDAYRLVIKSGAETVVDEELIETSYDISALGKGEYSVEMQTLADPDDVFRTDSDTVNAKFTVASLGAFASLGELEIEGGYIVWAENDARGYEVKVTEYGKDQALDLNGVKVADGKFMIAAAGLKTGGYTVTVTQKDNRHDSETGTPASIDISLTDVKSFTAADIAKFDGVAPVGEHGKAELVEHNGKQVAKVTPTVDGWGRIGSEPVTINYGSNPVLYIDIEDLEVGGFHAQIQVDGNNIKILDDGAKLADVAISLVTDQTASGSKSTRIRLGVDTSSTTSANDAVAYYNGCRVLYITDYVPPFEGKLEKVTGFEISNGMDIAWNAVENADSYYVTLENSEGSTVQEKTAQAGIQFNARDLAAGEYTLTVSAFNSTNDKALESDPATYNFKVTYLAEYSAKDISAFTVNLVGDSKSVYYDEKTDTAVMNNDGAYGYGAIAPATGVQVNLSNQPFAVVDAASIEYGYLIRGLWTEDGKSAQTLVLRNDTVGALTDTKLYIELWKKADQNGAPVFGKGTYAFGMGFLAGEIQGKVVLNGIKLVEITEVSELDPDAHAPLAAPSDAKEEKGVLSANSVKGNEMYTPTYAVTVAEKDGVQVYSETKLSAPSVDLAALGLTSGKTYSVTFKAEGDNGYFVDSPEYTVEVGYEEAFALTDFSALDYETMAAKKGGNTVLTGEKGKLTSVVKNGDWGYNFFNVDISSVRDKLTDDYYMQWTIDVENSTAGANIATRFLKGEEVVGTGWGDSAIQKAFLTREWNDKITEDGVIWFAFGQGGATVSGTEEKTVVCTSIKFVKFTVKDVQA